MHPLLYPCLHLRNISTSSFAPFVIVEQLLLSSIGITILLATNTSLHLSLLECTSCPYLCLHLGDLSAPATLFSKDYKLRLRIQVSTFISIDPISFTTAFNTSILATSQPQSLHLHLFAQFGFSWWLLGTVSQFYLTSNLLCSITLFSNRWNKFVLLLSLPLDTNFHTLRNAWFSPTMHLLLYPCLHLRNISDGSRSSV